MTYAERKAEMQRLRSRGWNQAGIAREFGISRERVRQILTPVTPEVQGKLAARQAVKSALARGELRRGPCAICGDPHAYAHHDNYAFQLDVTWLCRKHHDERDNARFARIMAWKGGRSERIQARVKKELKAWLLDYLGRKNMSLGDWIEGLIKDAKEGSEQ